MEINNLKKSNWDIFLFVIFGIAIGFINGFLGGGGGILVVIVLLWIGKLKQNNAHATALFIILPISIVSSVVYLINGNADWEKIIYATVGVVLGGGLGAMLLSKLKGEVTKLIFSIILVIAGVKMFL